jgi:hypothetical protein
MPMMSSWVPHGAFISCCVARACKRLADCMPDFVIQDPPNVQKPVALLGKKNGELDVMLVYVTLMNGRQRNSPSLGRCK